MATINIVKRKKVIQQLADYICSQTLSHPVRVGIDGVDGAGKTYLADELADAISDRNVIRASIDGFHHPKEHRYQKGRLSAEGYYKDSFNNQALIDSLLEPLGPSGNLEYRKAVFDYRTDSIVDAPLEQAKSNDVLIVDGVFLFRPELQDYWDIKIFVDVPFEVTIPRAIERYADGDEEETRKHYRERYVPGQEIYFRESFPKEKADIVIENEDFGNPNLTMQE